MAKKKTTKKRNDSKKIENIKSGIDFNNTIFLIAGILLFLFAFYLLTLYITNKHSDKKEEEEPTTVEISNEKILVGSILSMSKEDYLVLCYEFSADNADTYNNLYTTASSTGQKIYKVNMSDALNKKYKTESESNKNPTKESEFLINGPTLIKVSNNSVVDYIEGEEAIANYLS